MPELLNRRLYNVLPLSDLHVSATPTEPLPFCQQPHMTMTTGASIKLNRRRLSVLTLICILLPACAAIRNARGYIHGVSVSSHSNSMVDKVQVDYSGLKILFKATYRKSDYISNQFHVTPIPAEMTVQWRTNHVFHQAVVPVGKLAGNQWIVKWLIDFNDCGFDVWRHEQTKMALNAPQTKIKVYSHTLSANGAPDSMIAACTLDKSPAHSTAASNDLNTN